MQHGVRPGDVLADRYLLVDLLTESGGGRFWRAHDRVLARHVALHVVRADDPRAPALLEAARTSARVTDRCLLRVLDAEERDGLCFVVNEWGSGRSLDIILATEGPLAPRRAAWVVRQAATGLAAAHAAGVPHGHLIPENLLVDRVGAVRLIGFSVDAALRGIDPSPAADVRGLAALLYAALTGRWPGPPPSQVTEAPRDGVLVMRPRQVRAGIPRSLDQLCDEVLNPHGTHHGGAYDAARLAAALAEVVGDDTGMAAAEAARHRTAADRGGAPLPPWPRASADTTPVPAATGTDAAPTSRIDSPLAPAASLRAPEPAPEPAPQPDATAGPEPDAEPDPQPDPQPDPASAAAVPEDRQAATEAGLPIFDDDADEVEWLRHSSTDPEPPPPFEEPPERPLFAPGPPDDARTHRGRQEEQSRVGSGTFWPWDTGQGPPPPPLDEPEPTDDHVPGRRSMATAVVLILVIVLGVAGLVAYSASGDGDLLGDGGEDEPTSEPRTPGQDAPTPLTIAGVTDLDPQGDPPTEYPELAPLAADGDPETAWRTSTYAQQFGPEGLKTGVGLVADLGEFRDVAGVRVQVEGETALAVYVADTQPSDVADLTPLAEATGSGTVDLTLEAPDTGRYVVVWLDSLPAVSDGFRGEVAEISVLGRG